MLILLLFRQCSAGDKQKPSKPRDGCLNHVYVPEIKSIRHLSVGLLAPASSQAKSFFLNDTEKPLAVIELF